MCRGVGGSTGLGIRLKENRQDTDREDRAVTVRTGRAVSRLLSTNRRTDTDAFKDTHTYRESGGGQRRGKRDGLSCDVRHHLGGCMGFCLDGVSGVATHVSVSVCYPSSSPRTALYEWVPTVINIRSFPERESAREKFYCQSRSD